MTCLSASLSGYLPGGPQTCLPSTEKEGIQPGERQSGIGALPGSVDGLRRIVPKSVQIKMDIPVYPRPVSPGATRRAVSLRRVIVEEASLLTVAGRNEDGGAPPPRVVARAQPVRRWATFANMRRYILYVILCLIASIVQIGVEFQSAALSAAFNLSSPLIVRITSSTAAFAWPHHISISLAYSVGPIRVEAKWSPKTTMGPEDYASASAGGRVADVLCSPSYLKPQLNHSYISIYARLIVAKYQKLPTPHPPSILLSPASSKSWRFAGRAGTLGIMFAHKIHISEVALDHPASTMSTGSAHSTHALRSVVIWGITNSTLDSSRRECRPVHDKGKAKAL
ncbi:hypothetical protein FA95DRAFT_1610241 [Auriscalpium vulgare]|uniref:Uncharacterized protein n=1 Tax=Auriscalpium vulgare TaxID=40419 RepID=A0ACB8REP0_9AGAM|nr:hypothetical protein FA95DRAFT_1610241 [Auriscalpium vulgare]